MATLLDMNDVPIRDESIRLGQFLKLANLIDSGAEAKEVIADGHVTVNGDVEVRRPLADGTWWTTWCRLCAAPTGAPTSTRGVACRQAKNHLRGKNHQAKMGTAR